MAKVEIDHKVIKSYSYTLEDITLTFSLNVEDTEKLVLFRSILDLALAEVEADIEKINES
jgi:ribosomal protein L25 (general stress protein Ctc)